MRPPPEMLELRVPTSAADKDRNGIYFKSNVISESNETKQNHFPMPLSKQDIPHQPPFPTASAVDYLECLRWPSAVQCPRCRSGRAAWLLNPSGKGGSGMATRRLWKCPDCRCHFSVTTGTILTDSKLALDVWISVVAALCETPRGLDTGDLQSQFGFSGPTARLMLRELRWARSQQPLFGVWKAGVVSQWSYRRKLPAAERLLLEDLRSQMPPPTTHGPMPLIRRERLTFWPLPPAEALAKLLAVPPPGSIF